MILNEKINKFYYQQKFFNAARKYPLELRRIILKFLQEKGVTGFKGRWRDENIEVSELDKMDPKTKAERFRHVLDNTDINKEFFAAAKTTYRGKIEIVPVTYKGKGLIIKIATNEEFFIDGHDLIINIKGKDDDSYNDGSQYLYKINLMSSVDSVLEEIWNRVEESIKRFDSGDTGGEKEKRQASSSNRNTKSDIERMVNTYLQQWTKKTTYKSGKVKKTKYTEWDKLPVEFAVKMGNRKKEHSTLGEREHPGFSIMFNVKKTQRPTRQKLTGAHPNIAKWYEIYRDFMKEYGKRYVPSGVDSFFENWSIIDDRHDDMFRALKFVTRRLIKQGYIPTRSRSAYKKGDMDQIGFQYSPKVKKDIDENGDSAIQKYMDKYFKENVDDAFHKDKIKMEDIPKMFIKRILDTETRR